MSRGTPRVPIPTAVLPELGEGPPSASNEIRGGGRKKDVQAEIGVGVFYHLRKTRTNPAMPWAFPRVGHVVRHR